MKTIPKQGKPIFIYRLRFYTSRRNNHHYHHSFDQRNIKSQIR